MKITDIIVHWLRIPLPAGVADSAQSLATWDVVAAEVQTDNGPTGWGYNGTTGAGSAALVALLRDDLAPRFIGQDPFAVRRLWKVHYLDRLHTGIGGIAFQGVAAIEVALWDLVAKECGQPLWRLLGGFETERIPLYRTDGGWLSFSTLQLAENARATKETGFAGFKMKVGTTVANDYERVAAVRTAVGPDYPVMIDANSAWDLPTARRAIAALAPLGIYWLEEPLHPFDVKAHALLARETAVPIVAGESILDVRMFRDLLEAGALGIAQPDVMKLGGIANWLDVAALARVHGVPVVPAAYDMMQLDVQLMAATPNGLWMECLPWLQGVFAEPLEIEAGHVAVPTAPGAGTRISPEALARFRVH